MSALEDDARDVSADEPSEPACEGETPHDIPVRRFVADVLLLLAIYAPIRLALFFPTFGLKFLPFELAHRPLTLPESAYAEPLVFPAALTHLPTLPWYVLSAGFVAAHFWAHPKNPLHRKLSWGLGEAPGLRWVALALMLPIVWKYGTMDVNLYFDQAHLLDRALLFGLWIGTAFTPLALPFLLAFGATFASQLYYPDIFHFTWADKAVLFYSALLIWVGLIYSRLRRVHPGMLPALIIACFGSFYFAPGFAKLNLTPMPWDWLLGNPIEGLFIGAYVNGWLAGVDLSLIERIAAFLGQTSVLHTGFTMCLELLIPLLLLHRYLALGFLCAAVLFHLGVVASSGIFFWEWAVPELALIACLLGPWKAPEIASVFARPERFLTPVLIVFALPVFWPFHLGWLDATYFYSYDLRVTEESGEVLELNRGQLDPYNLPMTQNRFAFLVDRPTIPQGSYGAVTDYALQQAILGAESLEEIEALYADFAVNAYDPEKRDTFELFLQRTFANERAHGGRTNVVPVLESFHHQYETHGERRAQPRTPVVMVEVLMRTYWFDGAKLHAVGDEVIFEVDIPDEAPPIPFD